MLKAGALVRLARPCTVRELSSLYHLDESLLQSVLQFIVRSTDILLCAKGHYRLGSCSLPELIFHLEKFAGGYGPAAHNLSKVLARRGEPGVAEDALARAFAAARGGDEHVAKAVARCGVRHMLDLGCGPAWTLLQLCAADQHFQAFGIEKNPVMFALARANVREAGFETRLRVRLGDGRHPDKLLSREELRRIELIHGRSFLNEFFGSGDNQAIEVLKRLGRLSPGRAAWFTDYYSELNAAPKAPRSRRLGLLQDLAQLVSLQGIPPADLLHWERIYKRAGCRLVDAVEFKTAEIRWFTHHLLL